MDFVQATSQGVRFGVIAHDQIDAGRCLLDLPCRQIVEHREVIATDRQKVVAEIRTDEAGAPSDKNLHGTIME